MSMTTSRSSEQNKEHYDSTIHVPQAHVVTQQRWSLVWLIPLLAGLLGVWLIIKWYSERGPTITIEFKTAAGLQAGKTEVKFKDVTIGQVTDITVGRNLDTVLVTAELAHGTERYLTTQTRFWVARPRITASQVSGLETLLSGAYVAIDPILDGDTSRHFVGLDDPPVITMSEPGTVFQLRAPSLGSLNLGSPVYYRHIQVGQVVDYHLSDLGDAVTIGIFVAAPYNQIVYTDTRFWNASGFDFKLSADGIAVDTESLMSILIGGIAFDTPETLEVRGQIAPAQHPFPLYASKEQAHERIYFEKRRFIMLFDGSVRGLSVDAPVMLRGIQIGRVLDIQLKFDQQRMLFKIPVLIEIEPERIGMIDHGDQPAMTANELLKNLLTHGLSGQLKLGSLLTGQLYIDLDLNPEQKEQALAMKTLGEYPVLPTKPAPLEELASKANRILSAVETIPFEELGTKLTHTITAIGELAEAPALRGALVELENSLQQMHQVLKHIDQQTAPELDQTLNELQRTLKETHFLLDADAPFYVELIKALREVSAAARTVRHFTDYLDRHPEALLQGKKR
jgi:paraquat-inducible protein B